MWLKYAKTYVKILNCLLHEELKQTYFVDVTIICYLSIIVSVQ